MLSRIFNRNTDPPAEQRSLTSISDPGVFGLFGVEPALSGVSVNETSAMGLSAVYACVRLLSGVIASLPLRTVETRPDNTTQRVRSWLDDPAGASGPTPHEFVEDMIVSLLLRGNWFGLKVFGGGGQLLWLQPIPSHAVSIDVKNGHKVYKVQLDKGGIKELTDAEVLHIPGPSLDGVRGVSPISIARQSLGTALAGERAAGRLWQSGLLASAIVSPTQDFTPEEAAAARESLDRIAAGEANAGKIAFFSKELNVSKWAIDPVDAQWLESRKFSVAEIARLFLVPPHMIGDVERSTSWGSGIAEQVMGFQKFTLQPWTSRIEARLSRLLPEGRKAEFDYRQLIGGSPEQEIELLMKQTGGQPILSVDEARAIQNRPPLPEPTTPQENAS